MSESPAERNAVLAEFRRERYLCDGVYVSFDGWNIWLRAEENRIAIEPQTWADLGRYVAELQAALRSGSADDGEVR